MELTEDDLRMLINIDYEYIVFNLIIDNIEYKALVDTGSKYSLINSNIVKNLSSARIIEETGLIFCGKKSLFKIIGNIYIENIIHNSDKYKMIFRIVNNLSDIGYDIILGIDFISIYRIDIC
jgi:hypothetical protein